MDIEPLEQLGLTQNEAKTYIALCSAGSITAGKLAKRVDIHRSRMYEALSHLARKGLVHFVSINKVSYYEAKPPEALLELIAEQKEQITGMIPKLRSLQQQPEITQKVHGYQGIGGVKTLLSETLKTKEYVVFGAPQSSLEILGETYWKNYNQKINATRIKTKMIFDGHLKDWSNEVKRINKGTKIKFLEKRFDNLTETFVFDDKIIIITWSAQPLGVLLIDKTISKAYLQFFDMLWKQAKE